MQENPGWVTIPRMLRAQAETHADDEVVHDGDVTLTLGDLRTHASTLARALIAHDVAPGDRVAIWAPNTWEWVVTAYGVWDAGAVVVPINTRNKAVEAGDLLLRSGAKVLVATGDFLGTNYPDLLASEFSETTPELPYAALPDLEHLVVLDGEAPGRGRTMDEFLRSAAKVDTETAEATALAVTEGDLCEILSTSGTTGVPKGVPLTHAQMLRAYWDWSVIADLRPHDRYPVASPFAHGFGINAGVLAGVMRRATILPIAVFDPERTLELISGERVNFLAGPPNLFANLLNDPALPSHDLSSLRVAIVGAASVPEELILAMKTRLGFERVVNAYGLIEGSVVTMTRAEDPASVVATTAGRPVPGVEVRIGSPAGSPPGTRGEILVRGYGVTKGYWGDPANTATALTDNWLHTGDVGVLDEDGNLSIVGRIKEMFIVGGFNAYPAEIENLLMRHPDIAQAAVVPVADAKLGEVGWAYVVPEPGATPDTAEMAKWARSTMSNYKVPRGFVVVEELPLSPTGKINKAELRDLAATAKQQYRTP